jgi:uncharacterized protein YukE
MTTEQRPSMHHSLCYGPRCDGLVPPTDDDGNELVEPRPEIPCPCECHVDASGAPRPVATLALLQDAARVMSRLVEAWVGDGTGDEEELLSGYNAVMERIAQTIGAAEEGMNGNAAAVRGADSGRRGHRGGGAGQSQQSGAAGTAERDRG